MNNIYLKKLEFDKIIDTLKNFCFTYKGIDFASMLHPSCDLNVVKQLLCQTSEAVNLSYRNGFPSFYDFFDITVALKILESNNSYLSTKSLLNLAHILKLAYDLKTYFYKDFLDITEYPILNNLFSKLYTNKDIYTKIFSCILDENTIDDKASQNLYAIRNNKS